MTTLRDPVFWKLNKLVVNIVDNALKVLPTYTRSELYFPGIELVGIDVKKISTYFDYFQFDVTDALKSTTTTTFQVKIGQSRLNHKPFTAKLNITSLVTQKGLIKIFLGPKTPPGDLVAYKNMFVLLDSFECSFKKGINAISRSSDEMSHLATDFTSLKSLRKNVVDAEFGLDSLPLRGVESMLGFPSRLIVPRGTEDGLPLQIFVFIAPFVKITPRSMFMPSNMEFNSEVLSPGFPFDLSITDAQLFELPNALIKEILVTHKGAKITDNGGTSEKNNWQQSTGQDYSGKENKPFDYKSKKAQYGKKTDYDYTAKKGDYSKYKNPDFSSTTESIDKGDVVNYITKNKVDQVEIRDDNIIEKGNFDKDTILDTNEKKVDFNEYILIPKVSNGDNNEMVGQVDLNKNNFFVNKDYDTDLENTIYKTKSTLDYDDNKMLGQIDVNKDVHVDNGKKMVDFDKQVNVPTHKYANKANIDNDSVDKLDLNKEVVVHIDTNNNTVDFDKKIPIHREGIDEIKVKRDDKSDVTKTNTKEFFVIDPVDDNKYPLLGPTGPKYRKPSIYDYLVHPNYYDDYFDEKVYE